MQIDLLCPVENQGVIVRTNSKTGIPYAMFKLFNLSEKTVQRVVFTLHAYDTYGNQLGSMPIELSDLKGEPKSYFASNKAVSLDEFSEAKHIMVEFSEIHFQEGDPYIVNKENLIELDIKEPDTDEKNRLISAAGEDAVCYAKDTAAYWVCVCGRPNMDEAEECIRCSRAKKEVMVKYSSREAITKTLALMEEERLKAEQEAEQQAEKEKAEKIVKRKKTALYSAGAIVVAAIICVIGYFIYIASVTSQGDSAAKSGDYLRAYTQYVKAGNSDKVAEISEKLRGNSNMNLRNMGIMTSDADHLYYVDAMANIYKENRQTGEKTKLGDASGLMLNVMDGWVYYKDGTTGNLCRISTDGATKEIVVETTNSILAVSVIGNEIYYIQSQPKKNLTPDLQELIAAGQMDPNTYHLYRLTVGSKKPKLVFKEDIKDLVYYKDRFYYLSDADGAVYSFDRQGKDQKKIASGPIYGFEIINDSLFYIDGTADEATKVPKLVLVRAETNGTYIEDIVNDKMVVNFIVDGEDIYYLAANQETGTVDLYKKSGSETTLVAEQCSELFNAKDGYILYLDSEGRLMKTKADKSGFEELELQLPAAN